MRSIWFFLWKYKIFIQFLILELICVILIIQHNFYHRTVFANSSNHISGYIYNTINSVQDYLYLRTINEELLKENAILKSMHSSSFIIESKKQFDEDSLKRKYSFLTGKVINSSINRTNNYLTLNVGSKHGVEKGMGVISPTGVAGIVKDVSENYASVFSILHRDIKVSGKIGNHNVVGTVEWGGENYKYADLKDIARYHEISQGDSVVTSGFSQIFPEGILIGVIDTIITNKANDFLDIRIELATDFSKISLVYIVRNHIYAEQEELERRSQNE